MSVLGKRTYQEDAAHISEPTVGRLSVNIKTSQNTQIYGVFDGHGNYYEL